MTVKRIWIVVGVVGVVAVLILGSFLVVSPIVNRAFKAESDAQLTEAQNRDLEAQVEILAKQFEDIESLREDLAEVLDSVPGHPALADFVRQLAVAQNASGTGIVSVTIGDAAFYAPAAAQVEAPPAAETSGGEPGASPAPVPAALGTAGVAPTDAADSSRLAGSNFVLIPIDLGVAGDAERVLALADALQRLPRLFLVTTVEATGGDTPTGTISGYIYVLPHDPELQRAPKKSPVPEPAGTSTPAPTGTPAPTPTPEGTQAP